MRVAVTIWGKRISPVFDVARTLLIAENISPGAPRELLHYQTGKTAEIIWLLREREIQALLTGAISESAAEEIERAGIELHPFLAGRAETVMSTYLAGNSLNWHSMPGCSGDRGYYARRFRNGRWGS